MTSELNIKFVLADEFVREVKLLMPVKVRYSQLRMAVGVSRDKLKCPKRPSFVSKSVFWSSLL